MMSRSLTFARMLIALSIGAASLIYQSGSHQISSPTGTLPWWFLVTWSASPLAAGVACLFVARHSSAHDFKVWLALGGGCCLWAVGTLAWQVSGYGHPSFADLAYLAACLFLAYGVYLYGIDGRLVTQVQLANFVLIACAVGLSTFFLLAPSALESELGPWALLAAFLQPSAWICTAAFGATCCYLYSPPARRVPLALISAAALAHGFANLLYAIHLMEFGSGIEEHLGGWRLASFLLIIWAAFDHYLTVPRSMGGPDESCAPERRPMEAMIPPIALTLVCVSGVWLGSLRYGGAFFIGLPLALVLAVVLGLRERWILRTELELRAASTRIGAELLEVLESTFDSVAVVDQRWNLTYANRRARLAFADVPGFEIGANWWDIFSPDTHAEFLKHYQQALEKQEPVEFEAPLPSGNWLQVHAHPTRESLSIFFRDITQRRRALEDLERLAQRDPLTGMFNRRTLTNRLQSALDRSNRGGVALLFLDLDHFKEVNDTAGHATGDALLQTVAQRLTASVRHTDTVARIGGDEFAILVEPPTAREELCKLSRRVISEVGGKASLTASSAQVGVSVGIAVAGDTDNAEELLRKADIALYSAKSAGRSTYRFFDVAMDERLRTRQMIKTRLGSALKNSELELFYQPIVDLRTLDVVAFEALMRWRDPKRGLLPPSEFIPVAEETGMIVPLGEWAVNQACEEATRWPSNIGVAVNVSSCEFKDRDLSARINLALDRSRLAPERLELEITESAVLHESSTNQEALRAVRERGVGVALDDFGTGYSSLSYLQKFPFSRIKIDRTFVTADQNGHSTAIIRAVTDLGHALGMEITVEGVETRDQLQRMRELGCDLGQGYFFSPPVPRSDIPALLERLATNRISWGGAVDHAPA